MAGSSSFRYVCCTQEWVVSCGFYTGGMVGGEGVAGWEGVRGIQLDDDNDTRLLVVVALPAGEGGVRSFVRSFVTRNRRRWRRKGSVGGSVC